MTLLMNDFLAQHQLPASYLEQAEQHFSALVEEIVLRLSVKTGPLIVGINGSQGSGKSTLADYLAAKLSTGYQLRTVAISLDDFYYSRQCRKLLAEQIHPMLATRGVPGTHDLNLAVNTLQNLKAAKKTLIPRFDKSLDDIKPEIDLQRIEEPVDVVIFEGWCLGVQPEPEEDLALPINELEASDDPEGLWRHYVNNRLIDYQSLFKLVDLWVMLEAPSFSCVYQWRLEQEEKLKQAIAELAISDQAQAVGNKTMSKRQIARFIQYFQRITEYALKTLPAKVDFLYQLDAERTIIGERCRCKMDHKAKEASK
jgi:D-glycerate 3-kinase